MGTLTSAGFYAKFSLRDRAGNQATIGPQVVGADIATAKANAASLVTLINAVTDALIYSYTITEKFVDDTDTIAATDCQVENIASVVVELETGGKKHALRIPAPSIGIFKGTSGEDMNVVDTADADLIAYVEAFTDKTGYTVPGADAIALLSDGEKVLPDNTNDVPKIKSGKRIHRASRSG